MKVLPSSHNSPSTAYLQTDYPFGSNIRCMRRNWIETRPKFGQRYCYQTTKREWNKGYTKRLSWEMALFSQSACNLSGSEKQEIIIPAEYNWNSVKTGTYMDFVILYVDGDDNYLHVDMLSRYVTAERSDSFKDKFYDLLDADQKKRFDWLRGKVTA